MVIRTRKKPKAGKRHRKGQERGLNFSMASKGLTEKMGLREKLKGSARANYVNIWGKTFQIERLVSAKALR